MRLRRVAAILLIWTGLAVVGPDRLDRMPRLCVVNRVGHDCPGCGITRGFAHLARLEPVAATRRNVFTLPVAAIGALVLLGAVRRPCQPRRGTAH